MLSINLDDESERYLVKILKEEKVTVSELFKQLLRERLSRQSEQTILERMGGMPKHLLSVDEQLSDRDVRKAIIAKHIQSRHQARHE